MSQYGNINFIFAIICKTNFRYTEYESRNRVLPPPPLQAKNNLKEDVMNLISRLSIRARLLIGILLPVLLTGGITAWLTVSQLQQQGTAEVERLRQNLITAHKEGLKQVVEAARTAIDEVYTDPTLDEEEAKLSARAILRSIGFGEYSCTHAWTYAAYTLAARPNPGLEGPSRNATPERRELLRNLIEAGAPAWSSVTGLPGWGWGERPGYRSHRS